MEKKTKEIEETFNEVINDFIKIIDYDELDLLKFLNIKKEGKYYNLLTKKIFLYVIIYTLIMSQVFLSNILDLLISIITNIIISIIYIKIIFLVNRIDEISQKKFKFTIGFYKKERKDVLDYQCQIHILFNNQSLQNIIASHNKSAYFKKIEQINKRIENYKNAIKPITYKIKHYGIIGIIISLILNFFANFLIQYFQNQEIIVNLLLFGLSLPLIYISIFGIIYCFFKRRKNKVLYNYRSWLQLSKTKLRSKIKDLILFLYSLEFSELEKIADNTIKELKIKKETERLEKKKLKL